MGLLRAVVEDDAPFVLVCCCQLSHEEFVAEASDFLLLYLHRDVLQSSLPPQVALGGVSWLREEASHDRGLSERQRPRAFVRLLEQGVRGPASGLVLSVLLSSGGMPRVLALSGWLTEEDLDTGGRLRSDPQGPGRRVAEGCRVPLLDLLAGHGVYVRAQPPLGVEGDAQVLLIVRWLNRADCARPHLARRGFVFDYAGQWLLMGLAIHGCDVVDALVVERGGRVDPRGRTLLRLNRGVVPIYLAERCAVEFESGACPFSLSRCRRVCALRRRAQRVRVFDVRIGLNMQLAPATLSIIAQLLVVVLNLIILFVSMASYAVICLFHVSTGAVLLFIIVIRQGVALGIHGPRLVWRCGRHVRGLVTING